MKTRRKYHQNQLSIIGEQWVPLKFKGIEISDYGRLRDEHGILFQSLMTKGYARVKFGSKYYAVHRLVAQAFIPNPDNLPQVNHKDGNKDNNHVSNLEWCTLQYNMKHAEKLHLNPGAQGERNSRSLISDDVAKALFRMWDTTSMTHTEISKLTGLDNKQLRKIKCTGREHLDSYRNFFVNG